MMPGDIGIGADLPPAEKRAGCLRVAVPVVGMIFALLVRTAAASLQDSLRSMLSDGDLATVRGPLNRRAYSVRMLAGEWVITLAERVRGPVGSGRGPIEDEGADRNHQAYLESMGWTR